MIDSLIRFHSLKLFAWHSTILPANIPILFITSSQFHPVNLLAHISYYHVFGLCCVHKKFLLKLIFPLLLRISIIEIITQKLIHWCCGLRSSPKHTLCLFVNWCSCYSTLLDFKFSRSNAFASSIWFSLYLGTFLIYRCGLLLQMNWFDWGLRKLQFNIAIVHVDIVI